MCYNTHFLKNCNSELKGSKVNTPHMEIYFYDETPAPDTPGMVWAQALKFDFVQHLSRRT